LGQGGWTPRGFAAKVGGLKTPQPSLLQAMIEGICANLLPGFQPRRKSKKGAPGGAPLDFVSSNYQGKFQFCAVTVLVLFTMAVCKPTTVTCWTLPSPMPMLPVFW
jgi:hypothetical protein